MQQIWPEISDQFDSAAAIVEAFSVAFPSSPEDEYLDSLIIEVLARSGYHLPAS